MNRITKLLSRGVIAAGLVCAWHFSPVHSSAPVLAAGCPLVQSPAANIAPSAGFGTPAAIVATFDNARQAEGCTTPLSIDQSTFAGLAPQAQMLALFNAERQDRGLGTLQYDATLLSQIDLNHSREMAQYKYFNHPSPINQPGPSNVFNRLTDNPAIAGHWTGLAENIAAGYSAAAAAVYGYMYQDSAEAWGHRHNILGPYNWGGIGIASGGQYGIYYSSDFLGGTTYAPPATADTQAPTLSAPAVLSGSAASGGTVTVEVTNVQDMGAIGGEAGVTGVVFYANSVTQSNTGVANTVPAASVGGGAWQATMSVPAGAVIHAVAVDGSGNYTDCAANSSTCASASTGGGTGGGGGVTPMPSVTLSPNTGAPRTMTTAHLTGFKSGQMVYIYWDSTSTTPITSISVSTTGSVTRSFYVPLATGGAHTVYAVGHTYHDSASAVFTVVPHAALTYTSGTHGRADTLTVSGFAANESVTVHWATASGTVLGAGQTGTNGSGTVNIVIPSAPLNLYTVYATGSAGSSASATYRITS